MNTMLYIDLVHIVFPRLGEENIYTSISSEASLCLGKNSKFTKEVRVKKFFNNLYFV